jgi:hypothetical protein
MEDIYTKKSYNETVNMKTAGWEASLKVNPVIAFMVTYQS